MKLVLTVWNVWSLLRDIVHCMIVGYKDMCVVLVLRNRPNEESNHKKNNYDVILILWRSLPNFKPDILLLSFHISLNPASLTSTTPGDWIAVVEEALFCLRTNDSAHLATLMEKCWSWCIFSACKHWWLVIWCAYKNVIASNRSNYWHGREHRESVFLDWTAQLFVAVLRNLKPGRWFIPWVGRWSSNDRRWGKGKWGEGYSLQTSSPARVRWQSVSRVSHHR